MQVEKVSFNSADTVMLQGELFLPNEKTPLPSLVVCHGFDRRGYRGRGIFRELAQRACENGFVSLVFDFRGCGESSGRFGYGWGEQADLKAAVDYLVSRMGVMSDLVFVVGHSLGGAVALYVAEVDRRVKGVVLWATPYDHAYNIRRFIVRTRGWLSYCLFMLVSYVDAVVDVSRFFSLHVYGFALRPRDVRSRLMKLRECEVIGRLGNVRLLVVNGSDDQVVELKEARINYEVAKQPKQFVVIELANHVFQGVERETVEKTVVWLVKQRVELGV